MCGKLSSPHCTCGFLANIYGVHNILRFSFHIPSALDNKVMLKNRLILAAPKKGEKNKDNKQRFGSPRPKAWLGRGIQGDRAPRSPSAWLEVKAPVQHQEARCSQLKAWQWYPLFPTAHKPRQAALRENELQNGAGGFGFPRPGQETGPGQPEERQSQMGWGGQGWVCHLTHQVTSNQLPS